MKKFVFNWFSLPHRITWLWLSIVFFGLFLLSPVKSKPYGDGDFHLEAKALVSYVSGSAPFDVVSISKAPGPVLFYAIPYFAAGDQSSDQKKLLYARIWMCLLIAGMHYWIYGTLVGSYGATTANIFMSFTFAIPLHIYYSMGIWAECLAYLSILLVLNGFLLREGNRWHFSFYVGLFVLIMARPNAILSLPLLWLLTFFIKGSLQTTNYRSLRFSLVVVGLAVFISGLLIRQLPNTRVTYYQDDYFSYVQHIGRFQYRNETWDWRYWDRTTRQGSLDFQDYETSGRQLRQLASESGKSVAEVFGSWNWNDIIEHPIMTIKQSFIRLINGHLLQINSVTPEKFAKSGMNGHVIYWIFHALLNFINLFIISLAILLFIKYKSWKDYWVLLVILVAFFLFHGFVYMEQRYLFPCRVIYMFLASILLGYFISQKSTLNEST
jgi:hypothetical protein